MQNMKEPEMSLLWALKWDPKDVYTQNALGNTFCKLGEYEKAMKCHEEALRLKAG